MGTGLNLDKINTEIYEYANQLLYDYFIKKKHTTIILPHIRPAFIIQFLDNNGIKYTSESETNGWEWDYWIEITIDDTVHLLHGDGYYKEYCTIELNE